MAVESVNRRTALVRLGRGAAAAAAVGCGLSAVTGPTIAAEDSSDNNLKRSWREKTRRGLDWVRKDQSPSGSWNDGSYPTAMTSLAGLALAMSGSTTTQGPYSQQIRRAVDYLIRDARSNGLIGNPQNDGRYTYGHGFAMLFLSQILGEEEDVDRRTELTDVLTKAVTFSAQAQTKSGGWGYVSAKDGSDFDEGSTTITQVQGLRGCRNAGIPVPKEIIEKAKKYIYQCKNDDGGISYSSKSRGSSRPAITAASLACLYNSGEYQGSEVAAMSKYCKEHLYDLNKNGGGSFGHWHYTYLYYAQVVYREGAENPKKWTDFRNNLYTRMYNEQTADGSWTGNIGPIYVTACALIMLQLEYAFLPIFQR